MSSSCEASSVRSSSIKVFQWGCLQLMLSSIEVIFQCGHLSLRSSSIEAVFHWGRHPLTFSSIWVLFHWRNITGTGIKKIQIQSTRMGVVYSLLSSFLTLQRYGWCHSAFVFRMFDVHLPMTTLCLERQSWNEYRTLALTSGCDQSCLSFWCF